MNQIAAGLRPRAGLAGIAVAVMLAGCAAQPAQAPGMTVEEDVARVIKLPDGSTCTEPANLGENRQLPGALQLKDFFASAAQPEEKKEIAKQMKVTDAEVEAAWFDYCRAWSKKEVPKEGFEANRGLYIEMRQALLSQGIKAWVDKKGGIEDAGKLCLVVFDGDPTNTRNRTSRVPDTATVDDCAVFAARAGAGDILLGCTEGHWKNHWAKRSIAADALGTRSRGLVARDTPAAPDPNCGWL